MAARTDLCGGGEQSPSLPRPREAAGTANARLKFKCSPDAGKERRVAAFLLRPVDLWTELEPAPQRDRQMVTDLNHLKTLPTCKTSAHALHTDAPKQLI